VREIARECWKKIHEIEKNWKLRNAIREGIEICFLLGVWDIDGANRAETKWDIGVIVVPYFSFYPENG
jgi:hypothetical protein